MNTDAPHTGSAKSCPKRKILISGAVVVGLIIIFGGLKAASLIFNFGPQWYSNYAPTQPIPFSHKIHAGDFNIPCLYCHGAAERAAFAEVPGLELCMNCHQAVKTESPWIQQIQKQYEENQPIAWVKVHVLPDYVHFNHRRHIAAGVECQTCHGPVQEMEVVRQWAGLNMGWCIDCHRNDNYLTKKRIEFWEEAKKEKEGVFQLPEAVKTMLFAHKDPHNADVSCSTCHY